MLVILVLEMLAGTAGCTHGWLAGWHARYGITGLCERRGWQRNSSAMTWYTEIVPIERRLTVNS